MGANEKHAATYHGGEYTPDVDDLRDLWVDSKLDHLPRGVGIPLVPTVQAEFNRWLETVRAEAKAEALNEVADQMRDRFTAAWIRGKARDYTHGPHKPVGAFSIPENKEKTP